MVDNKGLTEMQEKFCVEYVETRNGRVSAINAGYSPKSASVQASKLLTQDKIKKRIAQLRLEQGIDVRAGKEQLLESLYNIIDPLNGHEAQHILKAIEIISKIEGLYKDVPDIKVENTFNYDPTKMTEEELEKKLKEIDEKLLN